MTRRAPDWTTFARDVMPHLSPLLGPWLDELLQRGAPPPTVRWVVVGECPYGRAEYGRWHGPAEAAAHADVMRHRVVGDVRVEFHLGGIT